MLGVHLREPGQTRRSRLLPLPALRQDLLPRGRLTYATRRPPTRKHRVLMTFSHHDVWWVVFWDNDHTRTPLPRKARFTTDEAMVEFIRSAGNEDAGGSQHPRDDDAAAQVRRDQPRTH
jgi:hypothetical protein